MGDERKYFLLGVNHSVNIPFAQTMSPSIWEPRDLDLGFNLRQHQWPASTPSPKQACLFSPLSLMQVNAHRQCRALHSTARWWWVLMRALAWSMFQTAWTIEITSALIFKKNMRPAHIQLQAHHARQHCHVNFPSLQGYLRGHFHSNISGCVSAS